MLTSVRSAKKEEEERNATKTVPGGTIVHRGNKSTLSARGIPSHNSVFGPLPSARDGRSIVHFHMFYEFSVQKKQNFEKNKKIKKHFQRTTMSSFPKKYVSLKSRSGNFCSNIDIFMKDVSVETRLTRNLTEKPEFISKKIPNYLESLEMEISAEILMFS